MEYFSTYAPGMRNVAGLAAVIYSIYMRVHFFVRTLNYKSGGGSHYNSMAYIRALRAHGHTVVVHVLYPRGNDFPPDIEPVVHQGFGLGHFGERAYIAELLKQYESEADAFFLYSVEFMYGGGLYRRRGGAVPVLVYMDSCIPSLFTTNFEAMSWSSWFYQFKRWPWDKTFGLRDARSVDRFLPCSPYIGETYIRFGYPKDSFTVLPNIVRNTARPRAPHDARKLTVLYVGRFALIKGVDMVVNAMVELKRFGARLVLVGDGEMRASLEQTIRDSGINASMPGWIPEGELGPHYEAADIFVHPTRCLDAAPRSVTEAVQWGLPAVVPDTGGAAWIAGKAGLVYRASSQKALTRALQELLESADLRAKLSLGAPAEGARFEEGVVYPQLEAALLKAAAKPRS